MVHQHFMLVENFTVLENVILGTEGGALISESLEKARKELTRLGVEYGLEVDLDTPVELLSVGILQRVEILKGLYKGAKILILDEPTGVLTPQETDELFRIFSALKEQGVTIILITHKLKEIKQVADRCSVLRKGKYIGTVNVKTTSVEKMAEMMVGREVSFSVDKDVANPKEIVLEVKNLSVYNHHLRKNVVTVVSFNVRKGEILCVAGIEGNGQTQLIEGITGLNPIDGGSITLNGIDISHSSVRQRNLSGVSHIPEDRHKHGLVLDYTLEKNLILQTYFKELFQHKGFLKFDEIRINSDHLIERFDIRSGKGSTTSARSMSGGNQQKVIVAREINRDTDLLIAVQPTRGLDVGAIEYIHKQLIAQRDAGKAILLVSLELDEVMNVSDRIIVMYEGENVGEFDPAVVTENELGLYMAGSKRSDQ